MPPKNRCISKDNENTGCFALFMLGNHHNLLFFMILREPDNPPPKFERFGQGAMRRSRSFRSRRWSSDHNSFPTHDAWTWDWNGIGCFRKPGCQQSVLHGRYDSEVWVEVCFGGMIRGMIRPTFFTVYIKTMSYIKGADWAMAQQSEVWVWFGVCIGYESGYDSGRRLFLQK